MHSEHTDSSRTLGPKLCSSPRGVVAQGGATRDEVARNSGSDPSESGESQSQGNRTRTAQRRDAKSPAPKLPTVYIAGSYRGPTVSAIRRNIERAREAAELAWTMGAKAFCPHLNTAFMDGIVPDAVFLRADLEWLAECHAVFAIHGWEQSAGARGEVDEARRLCIPVFTDEVELRAWITDRLVNARAIR